MFHFQIRLHNRSIIQVFEHLIMSAACEKASERKSENRLRMIPVTYDNKELLQGGAFNYEIMSEWVGKMEYKGWLFFNGGGRIGYIWVVYSGGDDIWYRIRKAEAFITDVFVYPEYRGHGYAAEMVLLLMENLKQNGISEVLLACRPYNTPAIKTYLKIGFETVCRRIIVRVCGRNIPYYTL